MTVTRFAPSPNGYLHLGHALSALTGWRAAREAGGRFLLRIEDIDVGRARPEFEQALYDDLAWLGLDWERPVRRQSEHFDDYRAALARLDAMGLTYPCFCTRKDITAEIARSPAAPHGPEGALYPGLCRGLDPAEARARADAGERFAVRLDVAGAMAAAGPLRWHDRIAGWQDADPGALGDVVLARKDIPTSYHLAVTVDDALQGVTLVTRGEDLFHATHVHRLLQALLGLPAPDYRHHGLIRDASGARLAKSKGAPALRDLQAAGMTPEEVRGLVGLTP
ncbi:MAG: tRNA glutamyl-Q(34) synthetase GluQRS [Alphaproteobacteria bacterium]|nr:tRNA glutamyl-Q(34) synthetase GluQRS [Alphaproteobacteria bacterium]